MVEDRNEAADGTRDATDGGSGTMIGSSPTSITRLAGCERIVSVDGGRRAVDTTRETDRDCCKTDNDPRGVIGLPRGALILGFSP